MTRISLYESCKMNELDFDYKAPEKQVEECA